MNNLPTERSVNVRAFLHFTKKSGCFAGFPDKTAARKSKKQ
jgi:hypothetical protein